MVRSILQLMPSFMVAIITTIIAIDAISPMLFGSFGKMPETSGWSYIIALYIVLAAIAPLTVIAEINFKYSAIAKLAKQLSAILAGSLLGFYYGGINSNQNPKVAIISAIFVGAIMVVLNNRHKLANIAILSINTVGTYAFALLAGITAINLFTASQFIWAIICAVISLIYIGLTIFHGNLNIKKVFSF